jgi:hypothetical protein
MIDYQSVDLSALPKQLLFDIAMEHQNIQNHYHQQSIAKIYDQCVKDFPRCHYHQHNYKYPKCEQ